MEPRRWRRQARSLLPVALVVLVALGVGVFTQRTQLREVVYQWAKQRGHHAFDERERLSAALLRLPVRLLGSATSPQLPLLQIELKPKHLMKLGAKRAEALEAGVLIQGPDDYVPALVRHEGHSSDVRMRLKGDWTDHLRGKKWSFRIHVRGDDHVLGMRRFSVQHPGVRAYHAEALYFETLRQLGVLTPSYFFVRVTLNGSDLGIMALEEHFSRELLESQGRRDGVILRFDESLLWAARDGIDRGHGGIFAFYENAPIRPFRSSRVAASPGLAREFSIAAGLLRGFAEGELPASRVFDTDRMGRFLAVSELWGAWHAMAWGNLRFYLDPVTLRLEPIAFDASLQSRREEENLAARSPLVRRMLLDAEIFARYREELRAASADLLLGEFRAPLDELEGESLEALRAEFPLLEPFPYASLERRARKLAELSEEELGSPRIPVGRYPILLHAHLVRGVRGPRLEITNAVPHEVEVESILWVRAEGSGERPFEPATALSLPRRLPPRSRRSHFHAPAEIWSIPFARPPEAADASLQITARIVGQRERFIAQAEPYAAALAAHPIPHSSASEQLTRHPFLVQDPARQLLRARPGSWLVQELLVVPPGHGLAVPPGTTLRFAREAGILAHGPLYLEGAADAPISLEGDGPGSAWSGVAVLQTDIVSEWSHVTVRGAAGFRRGRWQLATGVTFYESPVEMQHTRIEASPAETALSVVRATLHLQDVDVSQTAGTGFLAAFASGRIERGRLQHIGQAGSGTGIDVLGGSLDVEGTELADVAGPALSAGARGRLSARGLRVERAAIGAASRDGATLEIADSVLDSLWQEGLRSFTEKPEFGPGRVEARAVEVSGARRLAHAEPGGSILLDGRAVGAGGSAGP